MGKLRVACCACAASVALATAAGAESYSLVSGALGDQPLEGAFEAVLGPTSGSDPPSVTVRGQLGAAGYATPDVTERLEALRAPDLGRPGPGRIPVARELGRDLDPVRSIAVTDFALASGDRLFAPTPPISHRGLRPLQIADQIQLVDGRVQLFTLRSGGDVVEVDGDLVTFRFLDFRATEGRAAGETDGGLPRRIEVRGSVEEVDETYQIVQGVCPIAPRDFPILDPDDGARIPPGIPIEGGVISIVDPRAGDLTVTAIPPGGAIDILNAEASVTVSGANLDGGGRRVDATVIQAARLEQPAGLEAATLVQPAGRIVVDAGGGHEPAAIEGTLSAESAVFLVNPAGLDLQPAATVTTAQIPVAGPVTASAGELTILNEVPGSLSDGVTAAFPPPLPDGISSPDGLDVGFDAAGVLRIETDGDLFVEDSSVDVPGLTALHLRAARDIFITGFLEVPPGVELRIEAGRSLDVAGEIIADAFEAEGPIVAPGPIVPRPVPCPALRVWIPFFRETRSVGPFSLVASTARPAAVDVDPRRRHNRVHPHKRRFLPVALMGSADLDVRDVDPETLRLGDGGAPPLRFGGWLWLPRADLNRDGFPDLMALFDSSKAGIAFGDESLCLVAEKTDGELLEGCDAIDARPRSRRQILDSLRSR